MVVIGLETEVSVVGDEGAEPEAHEEAEEKEGKLEVVSERERDDWSPISEEITCGPPVGK